MSLIKNLEINEQTWKIVCNLSMIAPILKLHAIDGALQSPIESCNIDGVHIQQNEDGLLKVYPFNCFLRNEAKIQQYANEVAIMTQAFINKLQHVMILRKIYLGPDHAAFKMDKYQVDYRVYLQKHRNPRELRQILRFFGEGINELHSIGYIHRHLKPENIVLNFKPLSVRLIDFNRSNNTKMISSGLQ